MLVGLMVPLAAQAAPMTAAVEPSAGFIRAAAAPTAAVISLAGDWRFRLDPEDVGIQQKWASRRLPDHITLPGSTDQAGYGHRTIGASLDHLTRVHEYVGPAWYQRSVTIPPSWAGKRITLFLERCHWETRVFVDGKAAGMQNSLIAPQVYDLTALLPPGDHVLTIRVDNTIKIDIGNWAHIITDETQTNWNGIIGRIELDARDPVCVGRVSVYPDAAARTARVKAVVINDTGATATGTLALDAALEPVAGGAATSDAASGARASVPFTAAPGETTVEAELHFGAGARLWGEFSPRLYRLTATLAATAGPHHYRDAAATTFGLRDFGKKGLHFTLNGRPIFLRGTLECCVFPLTGYPPTDKAAWARIFRICHSYGLNHMRFHSWCPPEAAFEAADEAGFMLQVAAPLWVGQRVDADKARAAFIHAEVDRILDTYGNHPSFCLLSMGNELLLGGADSTWLQAEVAHCRAKDPRHLYTCTTCPYDMSRNDDYFVSATGPHGALRGTGWINSEVPNTAKDYSDVLKGIDRPIIAHELGQWAMYVDLAEEAKYTGWLKPRDYDVYRQSLAEHGMLDEAPAFLKASGALSVLLYRAEIERCLRTPSLAGFQLLDVHDFPGQGVALVGMLDAFWDSKGLITPAAYRQFCGPVVPLVRMPRRVWTTDQTLTATADVANYGPRSLALRDAAWSLKDKGGKVVASGRFPATTAPTGGLTRLGSLSVPLAKLAAPARYELIVASAAAGITNSYHVWLYPARVDTSAPKGVLVVHRWDDQARAALAAGRRVVLLADGKWLRHVVPGSFTPVFWCFRLFPSQPGTMGLLCDPSAPAFAEFPTESHTDWQWWGVLRGSTALILDETPPAYRPLLQVIDNFNRNHKLAAIFQARVDGGRLLATTLDLTSDLADRPAARQLLHSLLDYAGSAAFSPRQELTVSLLDEVFAESQLAKYRQPLTQADIARAVLKVRAATKVPPNTSLPWKPEHDTVQARAEGYGYSVDGGSWLDATDSGWFGSPLGLTVTMPKGFAGTLFVHFRDWNSLGRTGDITLDGRDLGTLGDHSGAGLWLALPVTGKDSADGKVTLGAKPTSGPNLMITQIVLVPK